MSLGEKIKAERKRGNLTQEQLAEKICVSRQAIQKWESDSGVPSIENLKALSQLFGVSIDTLLENDGIPLREEAEPVPGVAAKRKTAKWKIILPISVFLVIAIVLCSLIPLFISISESKKMLEGIYYSYEDGEYNTDDVIEFQKKGLFHWQQKYPGYTWEYGTYEKDGEEYHLKGNSGRTGTCIVKGNVLYLRWYSNISIVYKKANFE
ncbi:MAG: helix-turn-helix domain-containing protein [Clostridia bacterium]|nr:helix-turn-helix domain-containing protein [Clostridia bacterium]